MGAYIYKLSGTKNYLELNIDGKQEIVYEIQYWWEPHLTLNGDDCKPSTYNYTVAAIRRAFKNRPVKFISFPSYQEIFRVTHDNFADVKSDQLGKDCYPLVNQSLIK